MNEPDQRRDEIRLNGVRVSAQVGVPDDERRLPQCLELDVVLVPRGGCPGGADELAGTVDYESVWRRLREVSAERPRKLIETLANELASVLLREFPLAAVGIEVRKSILPGTHSAAVRIWRERTGP